MHIFPDTGNMSLCISAIVHAAHGALIRKNYAGVCNSDPAAIVGMVMRLQKHVKQTVNHALYKSSFGEVNWENDVLEPIIEHFVILEDMGVAFEDMEYLLLLATVITISYEILLLPTMSYSGNTNEWLTRTFNEKFAEPEICCKVDRRVETEIVRLERCNASPKVLNAVQTIRDLIPITPAWKENKFANSMSNHETANEHLITAAPPSTTSTNLRNSFTTFPRDVRIEVYLKPNQTYPFDFVDSITHRDNNLVIKTCIGLEMLVESGYTVSDISGLFDTTNITAANGDNTDALAATIVVPPGYAFRVVDVVDVCEMEGETARTRIETVRATLLVRTGDYVVVRRNCRDSVTVETTEC